jgi:hypothetical protein
MDELRKAFEDAFEKDAGQQEREEETLETTAEVESQNEEAIPEPEEKPAQVKKSSLEEELPDEVKAFQKEKAAPKQEAIEAREQDAKAPASWSAKARESWKQLPKDAQAEVMKRETEINRVLQESASARNTLRELNTVIAPHRDRMMANGVSNPIQAIGQLLATENQLRSGDTMTRAGTIARLIKDFNVDIGTLDNLLSGQSVQPNPNSDIERLIEQRMAPVNQFLTQQQQYQQHLAQQEQRQAAQSVGQFTQNAEFINEVRMDMADLLDMAAARGQTLSLDDAYKKACAIHPEVSQIMASRENQKRIMGANTNAAAKKAASVSITGQQGGSPAKGESNSIRDAIAQAWADQLG